MLGLVRCVCVRHFPKPAVLWRELVFLLRLWFAFWPLRRGAVSVAISESRTYRSGSVRCRACCARRGFSGAVFRRGFRLAAGVGGSSRALRPRAAIFPAICEWMKTCWPTSLVLPRRAPGDAFGTEDFPCGAAGSPITLRPRTKHEKRLTMALQLTAPRVTVAALPVRGRLVRPALLSRPRPLSALHLRSYRAALRCPLSLSRSALLRAIRSRIQLHDTLP